MSENQQPNTKFDRLLDQFEKEIHEGKKPSISKLLTNLPSSLRESYCREAISIEIHYRLQQDDGEVDLEDYRALGDDAYRYAEFALREQANKSPSDDDAPTMPPRQVSPGKTSKASSTSRQIGPYKLLQKIGEGGMGTVWLAEQEKPVRRRVALKLIKSQSASKEIIARFEAERQALAMMDHQNISVVLDAGTSQTGNPYFVMELIQGKPLNRYCDENELSISDRLNIMVDVCEAIQHAHQKGILHRDLKPANVLVTEVNGKPVPKVIDFGLAKATEHTTKLTDKTMFTEFGQVVGTLQYMSLEQAEMDSLDIDTRTDIYSLLSLIHI